MGDAADCGKAADPIELRSTVEPLELTMKGKQMSANTDHLFYRNLHKDYPVVTRGEGVFVWDDKGNRYIDGSGGACVVNIGHGVKEIGDAMAAQAAKICFVHGSHFTNEPARECAELLCRLTAPHLNKVYFVSGGSEAVETAVKLVRQYWRDAGKPDKYKVISRWTSFHGNTLGALSLGGHTGRRRHYLAIFPHTPHIEPAYCYRCPFGKTPDRCDLECAEQLERTIKYEGPDAVGAFIAEPVVGATAGAVVPRNGYWQRIREICDTYQVKLIADEVMTGVGRCGHNFALDHWKVAPDVIAAAKGLSSGYAPLGAVVADEAMNSAMREGSGSFVHGYTYSQNPFSAAVGAAVLRYIDEHELVDRSMRMGEYLLGRLTELLDLDTVGDVRGLGLLCAVELVKDKRTKETFDPQQKINARVSAEAFRRGLVIYPGGGGADGINGDHILLAPPFIITEAQIDEMVDILRESILAVR